MVAVVAGAWGFLGRAIAARLDSDGWTVERAGRPRQELPSQAFDDLLAATAPDVVVHCAGPASVPESVRDPLGDHARSVGVLASLTDSVRRLAPAARVLFLSSAAVYGEPSSLPVAEDAALAPVSPYGFHRLSCELLLRELTVVEGIPTASLRVFSAYGEGQRRRLLWDVVTQAGTRGHVVLGGTGSESRDFVHATDVASAAALVARDGEFDGGAYNVGTGVETSVERVARLLLAEVGRRVELEFSGERRRGDPDHWRADISRLRRLGFEPTVAIEDGAAAYARWALAAAEVP